MNLIADCMLPLQLVDTAGFRKFMHTVDPMFAVPSRRTVTRKLTDALSSHKENCKADVQEAMAIGGLVHVTMDLWSSRAMEPIAGIRFHYFDKKFNLCVKTAGYRHFGQQHTGENIAKVFEETLTVFGIPNNCVGCQVTDNAKNMIKAFDIFSLHAAGELSLNLEQDREDDHESDDTLDDEDPNSDVAEFLTEEDENGNAESEDLSQLEPLISRRLPCAAHMLQLVIKDALHQVPSVDKIIKEASSVVGFFHRSLHWGCELKKQTNGLGLLAAVPTRWNSSLIMLRRLSQENVWRAVTDTLKKARNSKPSVNTPPLSGKRAQLTDVVGLLENFEEATNSLQGDGVTVSMVIPAILGIDELLAAQKTLFQNFQLQLRSALQRRFNDILRMPEYVLATLLDPRYKMVPFMRTTNSDDEDEDDEPLVNLTTATLVRVRAYRSLTPITVISSTEARAVLLQQIRAHGLRELAISPVTQVAATDAVHEQEPFGLQPVKNSIFSKFHAQLTAAKQSEDVRYFATPTCPNMMPEEYWVKEAVHYPVLSKLARKYLSIPASSASVERLFSVCGAIIRARRARLSANTVEALLFHMERCYDNGPIDD